MTSFLIVSSNKKKREEYAKEYVKKLHIDIFDRTTITRDSLVKQNIQTIGIEDIKNLQKKIFLKPLKSTTKAVILEDAHLLTVEAQNALLKTLEEPPNNTIIILTAESRESLLPTIISRCRVIELGREKLSISQKEMNEYIYFIDALPKLTIREKLKRSETLAKDREVSLAWLETLIIVLREKMLEYFASENKRENSKKFYYFSFLLSFQQLYILLKTTNVNRRFAWEDTFLSFSE